MTCFGRHTEGTSGPQNKPDQAESRNLDMVLLLAAGETSGYVT